MESQRMKPYETLQEYFLAMRDLAHKGSLDESSLIDNVINGIPDSSNNKIILYGCKSISEFKDKLKIYEKLFNASKRIRHGGDRKFDPLLTPITQQNLIENVPHNQFASPVV
ncbi:hypothetical protein HNY73_011372 [Argiope bruennichi]|uniref:Uncharacterized protein n=1 Tax=Argiope bruennichi TaxID=94029 RepID=A0A8T0F6L8_ARGBR|nr:hypothetical protein HNY73_011372 [Argiope bruennichi]